MKKTTEYTAFFEGIADFPKTGGPAAYQLGRSVDHRTDTRSLTLLPKTIKESGSVVNGLIKWIVTPQNGNGDTYLYDDVGNIYKRTSAGSYSLIHTVPDSHGNGMAYFGEDDFLYYTNDKTIGRYGPLNGTATWNDDFFGSQGGVRTNTYALVLNGSTQYGSKSDTSSLSIAGDLSIEAHVHPDTLPTTGTSMVFASKWNTNGNLRSYKFDMTTTSNFFGDGSDGALTISADTVETVIDSACSGTSGSNALTATNAGFVAGQKILIHQTRGTGAGINQITTIQGYTAGTITTTDVLNYSYSSTGSSKAQVRVMKQYTDVTVNSGKTWTAKAWDGTVGGILGFFANGTFTNNGTITATGKGFRGAIGVDQTYAGRQGEGTSGDRNTISTSANGNGGGGGGNGGQADPQGSFGGNGIGGGGGGGNGLSGTTGGQFRISTGGTGGNTSGASDLTTITFGGGGGGGSCGNNSDTNSQTGGFGGGIICLFATTVLNTGSIVSNGTNGGIGDTGSRSGFGGGAGGSISIKSQVGTLGTNLISATGGSGGISPGWAIGSNGGNGSVGRINIDYYTSYTGTSSPTLNAVQDNTLGTSDGYVLRLQISDDGTNYETYSKSITPVVDTWQQVAVTWDASTSTATFYKDAVSLGEQTGSMTSISDNSSAFAVGCSFGAASAAENFYDGYIDEVRLWSTVRTQNDILLGLNDEILSTSAYLRAYYKFNNVATDSTSYANNLTLTGSPTYTTDTPFLGATTRLDIDQSATTAGNTYTTPLAIVESTTTKKVFTPEKDPQKSIAILVAAKGTGDWTVKVHDSFDNVVTSKTVVNASMATGYMEFVFSTPWRPLLNNNYHFHITSTVADGTVTTTDASDLSTVSYRTYYQFLVTDTSYHPITNMLQFLVIGNERYLGTIEATLYEPHAVTMPSGLKVRCFSYWNEYLSIGIWKGSTVKEYDQGRIYFWDGTSETYNMFIDIPEGAVNAMLGTRGKLYFVAGYRGKLMVYEGAAQAKKIKNLLNIDNADTIDIYPGAMTMWRTLLRIGVAGNADDANIQRGVYTWGSVNDKYPDSLSFDHTISTGNYIGNNVTIGCVAVVNSKLLIGWRDNVSYGVDYVDISNDPYTSGTCEFLIEDDGAMYHQKLTVTLTAQFEALNSGESVGLKYRLDRNSSWTEITPVTTADAITTRTPIVLGGTRCREYEIGVNLATTTTTSPKLLAISVERDELSEEKRVG